MVTAFNHVHFGAGKLGLGLIVPVTREANFKTLVITKKSDKANKEIAYSKLQKFKKYTLEIKKKKGQKIVIVRTQTIQLKNFHKYITCVDSDTLENKIATRDLRLITTAVGESNLGKVAQEIAKIIKIRFKKKINEHLIIIACENLVSNSQELKTKIDNLLNDDARKYLTDNVFFCNCVVDRVCPALDGEGKMVNVIAYEYYNWILNRQNLSKKDLIYLQKQFKNVKEVHLVNKENFELQETLKIWCFNGIHLALAVYGRDKLKDGSLLSEAIGIDRIGQSIRRLQNAYTYVISKIFKINRKKVVKYQNRFIKRIKENDDDKIERIIEDLLRVIQYDEKFFEIEAFLKKVEDRLIYPINKFTEIDFSKSGNSKISINKIQERDEFLADFVGLLASVIQLMRKEIHAEIVKRITKKIL